MQLTGFRAAFVTLSFYDSHSLALDTALLLAAKPSRGLAFSGIIKATAAAATQQSMGAMWPNIAVQQAHSQPFITIGKIMWS